ncbi:TIGR00730 family Rossman fold protein [Edaphobacter aggregans]|uniref:LOG family protein n=1 Tax=Edaphobacter aggregans TaxID=570835 RepID=UPI0005598BEA|nr:TIGR00730 family Rossman fold protein [Edaphobacter aggregans]
MATDSKNPAVPPTPEALPNAPLAYRNDDFLGSPDGRILRILSEYQEPLSRFRRERIQDTIVFFGSARFRALDVAAANFELLANTGSREPAAEQPASLEEVEHGKATGARLRLAGAAIEMAAYYEDARELANMLATWAKSLPGPRHRFVITSGGGPGIMEAANRGAYEAGAKTIGLNIKLPFEQQPNPYVTPSLNFDFHYFFMRKYWLVYLAKALVIFPGGFGTLDEMFEILTLAQTHKLAKKITVVIYGTPYWKSVINLDVLAEKGAIAPGDLGLLHYADTPQQAFDILKAGLTENHLNSDYERAQQQERARRTAADANIPHDPAPTAQEMMGPDIASTR